MNASTEHTAHLKSLAMTRWHRGHHSFHLHLSTMNSVIDNSLVLLRDNEKKQLEKMICILARLFRSATANMRYAADFPSEIYESTIRPSMMPPAIHPGFSGSLNRDHKVMLANLEFLHKSLTTALGSKIEAWPQTMNTAWQFLQSEIRTSRKNHGLICKKFVPEGPSLLREYYKNKQ